jgi:hypothetical protein
VTDQILDDRAGAYVGALEHLKLAERIKGDARRAAIMDPDNGGLKPVVLSDEYWSAIAVAAILSNLARADATVGILAGNYLGGRDKRIQENRRRQRDKARDFSARIDANRRATKRNPADHDEPVFGLGTGTQRVVVTAPGEHYGRTGVILQSAISKGEADRYEVQLAGDYNGASRSRPPHRGWFTSDQLETVAG